MLFLLVISLLTILVFVFCSFLSQPQRRVHRCVWASEHGEQNVSCPWTRFIFMMDGIKSRDSTWELVRKNSQVLFIMKSKSVPFPVCPVYLYEGERVLGHIWRSLLPMLWFVCGHCYLIRYDHPVSIPFLPQIHKILLHSAAAHSTLIHSAWAPHSTLYLTCTVITDSSVYSHWLKQDLGLEHWNNVRECFQIKWGKWNRSQVVTGEVFKTPF